MEHNIQPEKVVVCPHCKCWAFVKETITSEYDKQWGLRKFICTNPITMEVNGTIGRCKPWYIHKDMLNGLTYKEGYESKFHGKEIG